MAELVKDPVFDSFSESNSREGSLRAGSQYNPKVSQTVARLLACPEDASAPGDTVTNDVRQHGFGLSTADIARRACEGQRSQVTSSAASGCLAEPLYRPSLGTFTSASSFELSTVGSQELARTRSRSGCSAASLHARLQGFEADSLPLHWRQNVEDTDVPSCALFDHPCPVGPPPGARWGHASAAVGDCLFLFGGDGPSMYSDGFVYDTVQNRWSQLSMPASKSEEALPPMSGHAACAVGSKIFLYGGRQGSQVRKYLRRLYIYDTEHKTWKCRKKTASDPPGLLHATMNEVGRHGIFLFGGQSKRPSNAVYRCDPSTLVWSAVDTVGEVPCARQGHTAVWDFSDSLIVFGGLSESAVLNDVYILSLSSGFWKRKECVGHAPSIRYGHSAVMIACNLMLVFGGCSAQGAFYNDCHVLNTSSFCWHRLPGMGASPVGRHRHACSFAGGRVIVHGGSCGSHAYDNLFIISFQFGREFNRIATSLAGMQSAKGGWPLPSHHSSSTRSSGTTSSAGVTCSTADPEVVRQQLASLLQRRSANDMQAFSARRADIAESLLQKERQQTAELQAEVSELQLILEEQRREGEAARDDLRQERNSVRRTQQNHMQHMETAASEMQALQTRCSELEELRARLESQIRSAEQRCTATQTTADGLQQANVYLRQQLNSSQAVISEQASEHRGLRQRMSDLESMLAAAEKHCADQTAELAAAHRDQKSVERASSSEGNRLACLEGDTAALAQCSLGQLYRLESSISRSWQSVREALVAKVASDLRQREAALAAREAAAEEATTCSLCMDHPKGVVFTCGHQTCVDCSAGHSDCPFCRKPISSRIALFHS